MAQFDGIQRLAVTAVQDLFGDDAIWVPSDESETQTVKGLFSCPEEKTQLGDTQKYDYSPFRYTFEYYEDQFVGLKLSVDSGTREYLTIKEKKYYVSEVTPKFDGKTLVASLEPFE